MISVLKYQSMYRTIDGSCNNLNFPNFGAAKTAFRRFVDPVYSFGGKPKGGSISHMDTRPAPSSRAMNDRWFFGGSGFRFTMNPPKEGKWWELKAFFKKVSLNNWCHLMVHEVMSWSHVMKSCHEVMSWSHVMKLCHEVMSWSHVMKSCHEVMSWSHVMKLCHVFFPKNGDFSTF